MHFGPSAHANHHHHLLVALLRLFYALVPIAVVLLWLVARKFTQYGKLLAPTKPSNSIKASLVSHIAALTVPKKYFTHFYALGSVWSLALLTAVMARSFPVDPSAFFGPDFDTSMTPEDETRYIDIEIALAFMCVQVLRRLYECLFVLKQSDAARMHAFHYVNGILFYTFTPVAVIVEGMDVLGKEANLDFGLYFRRQPQLHRMLALIVFIYASIEQHWAHGHLASLRNPSSNANDKQATYVLPTARFFYLVACPHFFFEVLIYSSFVILYRGANLTTWLIVVCVAVELGVAAHENRTWYFAKFGDKIGRRSKEWKRIVPYLF
ncbi:hypothetical protein BC830DRAFT_1096913 [Chytriomyces sp. MP71]|nr:hypothetical protein BC830DRAFT_1096913 [Chytriomyces sp. MP71]